MDIVGATVAVQRRRGVIPIVQQRTSPQSANCTEDDGAQFLDRMVDVSVVMQHQVRSRGYKESRVQRKSKTSTRMRNRCSDEELAHEHLADSLRESAGTSHKHLMHLLGKISEKRTLTGQKQTRREAGRCS